MHIDLNTYQVISISVIFYKIVETAVSFWTHTHGTVTTDGQTDATVEIVI